MPRFAASLSCVVTVAVATTANPPSAWAFAPGGFSSIAGRSHAEITEDALDLILQQDFGVTDKTDASEKACEVMAEAAGTPDAYHASETAWHCDAENFLGCHSTIIEGRLSATREATNGRYENGQGFLGQVLHPLQDFYAHSNWIELGNTSPLEIFDSSSVASEIELDHMRQQGETVGSLRAQWAAIMATPDEATCRPCGTCSCKDNIITTHLTSGFYPDQDRVRPATPYKCDHGTVTICPEGINKDVSFNPLVNISPHGYLHDQAAAVAVAATAEFIRSIAGNELDSVHYRQLLGIGGGQASGPPAIFVVDTTESMQSIIDDVVQQIKNWAASTTPEYTPSLWMLTPFNDPAMAKTFITSDYRQFVGKLEGLAAAGGGDCPEPSFEAMYRAASDAPDGSYLYIYTNSAAKDADVYLGPLQTLVAAKNIRVIGGLFGSCSPYTPAFFKLAEDSGGQMFVLAPDEATRLAQLNQALSEPGLTRLTQQSFELEGAAQDVVFLVDSLLEKLVVSVSGITADGMPPDASTGNDDPTYAATLEDPSGGNVAAGSAGTFVTHTTFGTITKIDRPQPGVWKVRLSGSGHARVVVEGVSSLSLVSLTLLEQQPENPQSDYFPLKGSPLAGGTYKANARLRGEVSALSVEFHSPIGQVLSTHPFELQRTKNGRSVFQGEVTIPEGSFTIHAVALDAAGSRAVRAKPAVISGQYLTLDYPHEVKGMPGTNVSIDVVVQNRGPKDTFTVSAMDAAGYQPTLSEHSLLLGEGESRIIQLKLDVPADAALPGIDDINLAISSERDSSLNTAASVRVRLVRDAVAMEDGDLIPDANDNCPGVDNSDQSDLDKDAVGDACDKDLDGDGVDNTVDSCPSISNEDQRDDDSDGLGNPCDENPGCACSVPSHANDSWASTGTLLVLSALLHFRLARRRRVTRAPRPS